MTLSDNTILLFRPVGQAELDLIKASGNRCFPPRLPGQPIFYPVLNKDYAVQIARDWNAPDPKSRAGYVTQFRVKTSYLGQFTVRQVGATTHLEYWIPAERLAEFNENIVGYIEVIAEFVSK